MWKWFRLSFANWFLSHIGPMFDTAEHTLSHRLCNFTSTGCGWLAKGRLLSVNAIILYIIVVVGAAAAAVVIAGRLVDCLLHSRDCRLVCLPSRRQMLRPILTIYHLVFRDRCRIRTNPPNHVYLNGCGDWWEWPVVCQIVKLVISKWEEVNDGRRFHIQEWQRNWGMGNQQSGTTG